MRKVIYVSGPMKGYEGKNHAMFNHVSGKLREWGHRVYNPAEYGREGVPFDFRQAFACYSNFICLEACSIVMLPGWPGSLGANAELGLARNVGLTIYHWDSQTDRTNLRGVHPE